MPRPTFTASDIARYTFCNLAWSYDVLGVPTLSPRDVQREKAALLAKPVRSADEERDLSYLRTMEESYAKRASGETYHAKVGRTATTLHSMTRLIFIAGFILIVVILLLILFLR